MYIKRTKDNLRKKKSASRIDDSSNIKNTLS